MEIIITATNAVTTIEKASISQEIIINEGLLKGKAFDVEDLQRIKEGESFDCFGYNKIFDETFDPTFE